ncbi:MAG TPA: SIR2 family protein [Myxococcota bacterium]|nr:SIR2 family protein [Myxococcota bacterium]
MNVPIEVVDATRQRRCALFVGRRASLEAVEQAGAEYPDQRGLARMLEGRKALREASSAFAARRGRDSLISALQERIGGGEPGAFHRAAVRMFPRIFTTCWDDLLERAAVESGVDVEVRYAGDPIPEPVEGKLLVYKLWGGFERPETLLLTDADESRLSGVAKDARRVLRKTVCFFVGYRPDEEEFDLIFDELSEVYGGELPRCHLAVAQGRISDYHWQKWVWRGLLLFTADPAEALEALETQL